VSGSWVNRVCVGGREGLRAGGGEAETARTARHDGDLALEGEEGREVLELHFGHGVGSELYVGSRRTSRKAVQWVEFLALLSQDDGMDC
jgi:hypothetical protein